MIKDIYAPVPQLALQHSQTRRSRREQTLLLLNDLSRQDRSEQRASVRGHARGASPEKQNTNKKLSINFHVYIFIDTYI